VEFAVHALAGIWKTGIASGSGLALIMRNCSTNKCLTYSFLNLLITVMAAIQQTSCDKLDNVLSFFTACEHSAWQI